MSIASQKVKFATERFLLVRINPGRYIEPVINAGLYEITLPFVVNTLTRNGTDLTQDTSAPAVNDHWYQDESTGLLQVKLASAPNDTSNVLIAYHYLFYTGTIYRTISEDPEDDSTPLREWQPRIINYPSLSQSFDNILQGIFTISDVNLSLINEARDMQAFLDGDDSFFNKAIDVWFCIENVTNIKRIFSGTVKKITLSQNQVNITCSDSFNRLVQPALMGDGQADVYLAQSAFPNIDPLKRDAPLPYIVGQFSRYTTSVGTESTSSLKLIYEILEANAAANISYASPSSTSLNRNWIACRQKSPIVDQNFGNMLSVTAVSGNNKFIRFDAIDGVMIGDVVKFDNGGPYLYGIVRYVGDFTYLANPYNCVIDATAFTISSIITNSKSFGLTVIDSATGDAFECLYERDYTVDDTTLTTGGNRFIKINFVNNFEANISLSDPLSSKLHTVLYRSTNSAPETHGQILQDILGKVGIPVSASTFTAADAALVTNAAFAIPNFDEIDFDTYLKYAQDVLGSTLGFLRVNSSFEAEYYLLSAPASTDTRDNSLILQDSAQCDLEYQDIVTTLIAYNPHNSSEFETSKSSTPSETRSANKSRWLHGIENTNRFRHVLQTITDRIETHIGVKSVRFAKYHLETATQDIETELGDDLQLDDKIVLGSSQIQDVKVIGIDKSPGKIAIDASDLKGV